MIKKAAKFKCKDWQKRFADLAKFDDLFTGGTHWTERKDLMLRGHSYETVNEI